MKMRKTLFTLILTSLSLFSFAQDSSRYFNYNFGEPEKYTIKDIEVEGNNAINTSLIVIYSNLTIGSKISLPGREIQTAIKNLWKKEFFSDVKIVITKKDGDNIWLKIIVVERNRLWKYKISGLRTSETKSLKEELGLRRNLIITKNLLSKSKKTAEAYFREKGFYNVDVKVEVEPDPNKLTFDIIIITVKKGPKIKVRDIVFEGNEKVSDKTLRKQLKNTKRKKNKFNIFASAKFQKDEYEEEKRNIIKKYNSLGFSDAQLLYDSIVQVSDNRLLIKIGVSEGTKYYFGDITFTGNSKYTTGLLDTVLAIKKGDVYNQDLLEERLYLNPKGYDLSSIYMDDGYLFFNVTPVETRASGDTIDLEIRIYEGDQAVNNRITVSGNTKTSDHVVLRVLRTKPGMKFSRSDIQRSMRELAQMGMFDPETLGVNPKPNPSDGTVDIEYTVTERANDQIELSGGWGGFSGFIGTLGLSLNNFSARKLFKPKLWNPIPAGDGQRLSLRAQSNGTYFQSYNASFTEPWLGGKKPNSFSVSLYHSIQTNALDKRDDNYASLKTLGASVSLAKRLKWPDNYFTLQYALGYQRLKTLQYDKLFSGSSLLDNGVSHNLNFTVSLSRNDLRGNFIFPDGGSQISTSVEFTPPYSLFSDKEFSEVSNEEKYKLIEYHKWKFDAAWYTKLYKNFVFATKATFGYLGYYNKEIGASPFERFSVGGAGLYGFTVVGTEFVSQRGYPDNSISEAISSNGTTIMDKYTVELRYAISKNPNATVYLHTFAEAGNTWMNFKSFNPFDVKRAAGFGVRLFLPMFGLIGLDYAYGFDWKSIPQSDKAGQLHFFIGQQF
jgi:outer membrane protein insertion porin family